MLYGLFKEMYVTFFGLSCMASSGKCQLPRAKMYGFFRESAWASWG